MLDFSERWWIIQQGLFVALVLGGVGYFWEPITTYFLFNPLINGLIAVVLVLGMGYALLFSAAAAYEVSWFRRWMGRQAGTNLHIPPIFMVLVEISGDEGPPRSKGWSADILRTFMDSLDMRLDTRSDGLRYAVGLLVFLGLFGTFWGLLGTINGVVTAIKALSLDEGNALAESVTELKEGIIAPLDGMGTAFSSSAFGLGGSMVLNLMVQRLRTFLNHLRATCEDGLASRSVMHHREEPSANYVYALLEGANDRMERLERIVESAARTAESGVEASQAAAQTTQTLSAGVAELVQVLGAAEGAIRNWQRSGLEDGIRAVHSDLTQSAREIQTNQEHTLQSMQLELRTLSRTLSRGLDQLRAHRHGTEALPELDTEGESSNRTGHWQETTRREPTAFDPE